MGTDRPAIENQELDVEEAASNKNESGPDGKTIDTSKKCATTETSFPCSKTLASKKRKLESQEDPTKNTRENDVCSKKRLMESDGKPKVAPQARKAFPMWRLRKQGRGRACYWELGTFLHSLQSSGKEMKDSTDIMVGLHPNKNMEKNGIQLVFFRQSDHKKLGYLLMINHSWIDSKSDQNSYSSQLLGLMVNESMRKQGLAKLFLAIWLQCCLQAGILPYTGVIQKPLLCLSLQYTFGFLPACGRGVQAEISRAEELVDDQTTNSEAQQQQQPQPQQQPPEIVLYSSVLKDLAGAFSPQELKNQKMRIVVEPPNPRGRQISIGATFHPPPDLQSHVDKVFPWTRMQLCKPLTKAELCHTLTGKS